MLFVSVNDAPVGSFIPELNGFLEEVMIEPRGCVDCGEFDYSVFVQDKDSAKMTFWTIAKDHILQVVEIGKE